MILEINRKKSPFVYRTIRSLDLITHSFQVRTKKLVQNRLLFRAIDLSESSNFTLMEMDTLLPFRRLRAIGSDYILYIGLAAI